MSDGAASVNEIVDDPLGAGRAALDGHAWPLAYERLSAADRAMPLAGADLEGLAQAAFFVARADEQFGAKERAYKAYEAEGNPTRAAYLAIDLARMYGFAGKSAFASVWIKRAERLVGPDVDGDTYVDGYLALVRSERAAMSGDMEAALGLAERAVAVGERAAHADLKAYAQSNLGWLKITSGSTSDGLALMEEASLAAVNGELTPFTTGFTACRIIGACRDLTDYGRANEWIEATERYCDRQSLSGFPGICRIHRAEVAAVGGAWERAEHELEQATTELADYQAVPPQADGYYAIGDIRRLRGDLVGAQAALREAHARGRSPQPALALIRLAEGKARAAAAAIQAALVEQPHDRWARARLLPAQVEIAIAAGDPEVARRAIDELGEIVAGYPSPALEAGRQAALGRVLLAERDAHAAIEPLRASIRGWRAVGAPYEVARTRIVLADALWAIDDDEDAQLEADAAVAGFRQLGARLDIEAAERAAAARAERRAGPATARMTFMFTDIAGSTTLAETLGDEAWDRLLARHDEMLRGAVARHRGEVVKSTGDGFFVAFELARSAIDAAVTIQRALRDQREAAGFALSVRIGLHTADANRRGMDYSGKGIHVAARVAALADGGQILVTADVLDAVGAAEVQATEPIPTTLKGVREPVPVAALDWT